MMAWSRTRQPGRPSRSARGQPIGVRAPSAIRAIAALALLLPGALTENRAPGRPTAAITSPAWHAESVRTMTSPAQPAALAAAIAPRARPAAPRTEAAFPPRSRVAATAGEPLAAAGPIGSYPDEAGRAAPARRFVVCAGPNSPFAGAQNSVANEY